MTRWIKNHSAALVAVAATLGTLTHEVAGITGQQGVVDEVEAIGAAVAVIAAVINSYVQAAAKGS